MLTKGGRARKQRPPLTLFKTRNYYARVNRKTTSRASRLKSQHLDADLRRKRSAFRSHTNISR